jgi:hypothetical protein
MELDRITKIREEINLISHDLIPVPVIPTDSNREDFLFSELDTLSTVIDILKVKKYKECFILLRTVLEKFLFFWLMFEGKKYRHPMFYTITRQTSRTDREARDSALERWKNEWSNGDENFKEVLSIQPGKADNVIIVLYEHTGEYLRQSGILTEEIIPIYNKILEQYNPDSAHIGDLRFIGNFIQNSDENIGLQKAIYHNFFYIKNIFRNLLINKLVNDEQLNKIKTHYNFLSKYTHVGMDSVDVWKETNSAYSQYNYGEEVYEKLISLYVTRFCYLYLKIYVNGYESEQNASRSLKYKQMVHELNILSNDLWFFDNEPTEYDAKNSEYLKQIVRARNSNPDPDQFIYYDNPLERTKNLLNYQKSNS